MTKEKLLAMRSWKTKVTDTRSLDCDLSEWIKIYISESVDHNEPGYSTWLIPH